mmetsp:Transcript_13233/g.22011  ORF Transcript_13233/g.22011 Transcript_13233/m.22011 type:complete len:229 (-) Transcript_13233:173-859(-)
MVRRFAVLLLILSVVIRIPRSLAESQAGIFEGDLPFQLYSNGDGCTGSNAVGTGRILSLKAMDEPNMFCETDVVVPSSPEFDTQTLYTKIHLGCARKTSRVNVAFWDCSNSDCSSCISVAQAEGSTNIGNFTAARDNLTECFYGWPSAPMDGGFIPVIGYQTFNESMGATQAQDEEFFNVLIENSCLARMIHTHNAPTSGTARNYQWAANKYCSAFIVVALSLFVMMS